MSTQPPSRNSTPCLRRERHSSIVSSLTSEKDLIGRFQTDVEAAGLVGEQSNAAIVLLCAVSARLPRPLNLTVYGQSSAGKNYLLNRVAAFVPEPMTKIISGMSPKVLMHSAENEFEHKAVFIAEYEGVAGAEYAIRTMQSEQVIQWEFVDQTGSGLRKRTKKVRGPAAFIQATTRSVLHPENETRLLFTRIDESPEQTQAILRQQAQRAAYVSPLPAEGLYNPWHELIHSLDTVLIRIPFAPKLAEHFPVNQVRSRRDFPKLLGLIETLAFLHQHQRTREGQAVEADCADYLLGKALFEHCYSASPEESVSELVGAAESLYGKKGEFKVADLMQELGWQKTKVYQVLGRAEEMGCVAEADQRGYYQFVRAYSVARLDLPDAV